MKSTPHKVPGSTTTLRLAARIGLGFGSVIGIALLLGAMAIWAMRGSTQQARVLAQQEVPQVIVANNVERSSLLTMYEMRGYGLTEETNFLAGGRQHLVDVRKHLGTARELGQSRRLDELEKAAGKATEKVAEYERLVEETVRLNRAIDACRTRLDAAAKDFMESCNGYLKAQNDALVVDVRTNARNSTIVERHTKSDGIQTVMNLGNSIRVLAWRSQAERNPDHLLATDKVFADIGSKLAELRPLTRQPANLQQLEHCLEAANAYHETLDALAKDWRERDQTAQRRNTVAQAVLAEARTVAEHGLESTRTIATRTAEQLSSATLFVAMGVGIAMVVSSIIALFLTRAVTLPIKRVADSITAGSDQTASAAAQVSAAGQCLAEGSSEQAASLEETSSSLEEMASMTKNNSESARKANQLAREAREAADRGAQDMAEMSQAMSDIKSSSDDIAKIIKTIDEIAFQTNILALNAAVEAARAGEAGMGFAVVADEVRALAQRSAQAAKETSAKIEGAIGRTSRGVDITRKVEEALHLIVAKAREVDELAGQVAAASNEQSQGITQLNLAVGQMDKVVQSNAASAEESASAAEELSAQAECLKEVATELRILVDGSSRVADVSPAGGGSDRAHSSRPALRSSLASGTRSSQRTEPAPSTSRNGHLTTDASREQIHSGNGRSTDSSSDFGSF